MLIDPTVLKIPKLVAAPVKSVTTKIRKNLRKICLGGHAVYLYVITGVFHLLSVDR